MKSAGGCRGFSSVKKENSGILWMQISAYYVNIKMFLVTYEWIQIFPKISFLDDFEV